MRHKHFVYIPNQLDFIEVHSADVDAAHLKLAERPLREEVPTRHGRSALASRQAQMQAQCPQFDLKTLYVGMCVLAWKRWAEMCPGGSA